MLELLRDGIWQFVGALIALLSFAAAVLIYFMQKQRKELAFGHLSARTVLTVSDEISGRVSVTFDQRPVTNIRLVVVGLKNSGDRPILAADFERPLSVHFGAQARLLSVSVIKQSPTNLHAGVEIDGNKLTLTPMLFNSGDHIVIQALVEAPELAIVADTRIVDIPSLVPLNTGLRMPTNVLRRIFVDVVQFALAASCVVVIEIIPASDPTKQDVTTLLWPAPAILGGIVGLLLLLPLRAWLVGRIRNHARRYIDDA
jgi:hypothetical protein